MKIEIEIALHKETSRHKIVRAYKRITMIGEQHGEIVEKLVIIHKTKESDHFRFAMFKVIRFSTLPSSCSSF